MRFAEPFAYKPDQTPEEKLEAERLMFLELTQSMLLITLNATNRMLTWLQFVFGATRLTSHSSLI